MAKVADRQRNECEFVTGEPTFIPLKNNKPSPQLCQNGVGHIGFLRWNGETMRFKYDQWLTPQSAQHTMVKLVSGSFCGQTPCLMRLYNDMHQKGDPCRRPPLVGIFVHRSGDLLVLSRPFCFFIQRVVLLFHYLCFTFGSLDSWRYHLFHTRLSFWIFSWLICILVWRLVVTHSASFPYLLKDRVI